MAFPGRIEKSGPSAYRDSAQRTIAIWLYFCAAMVFLIVIIGGVTRLTESGLSITEWKPVSGVVPPLSAEQWSAEFAKYQRTPEYQLLKSDMSLGEFKQIFFWEYLHRLWGRLVGLAFVLPLLWFVVRGRIERALLPRLAGIGILIGLQGALGWYMVQSGLAVRTDVSQYRLAAHLSLALVIYAIILWTAMSLSRGSHTRGEQERDGDEEIDVARARTRARLMLILVGVTIVSGAFVAGLNAGRILNTFPLMNGRVVPHEYLELRPWYVNFFENPVAVQFNHRVLAMLTLAVSAYLWLWGKRLPLPVVARTGIRALGGMVLVQVMLGIATLLAGAPVALAAAHQMGAVLLLTAALLALHGLTPPAGQTEALYFALHRRGVAPRA